MKNMKLIEMIEYSKDRRLILLRELLISDKNIYIYGAGNCARNTYRLLSEYGIKVHGYCVDKEYYKNDFFIDDKPVLDVDSILNSENELVIGFENRKRALIVREEYSFRGVKVYYFEDLFCFRHMDYSFFVDNLSYYQNAFDLLKDELSRTIYVAHINSRIAGEYSEIAKYKSSSSFGYDYELLQLDEDDVFVDCGAFDGDTFEEILEYVGNGIKKYIAFEPDETNLRKLETRTKSYDNVEIINKGVYSKNEVKEFYNDGSLYSNFVDTELWGSKTRRDVYDKSNYILVPVCRIDDTIRNEEVTVIKMDIEGSELEALKGSEYVICKNHPKLAICIYHKSEDLFSCVLFINHIVGDGVYDYYIRHHSDNITETVLYAIPKNI